MLVVDDAREVRMVVRRSLERLGHTVLTAEDGQEGLDLALRCHASIDLVVTDLNMPNLCGREFVERLRAAHPDIPVIFVSGEADDETASDLERAPRTRFLHKPFRLQHLARAAESLLRHGDP